MSPGLRVEEGQVGDVGAQQGAGAADDRLEDAAGVAQGCEVAGGLDQTGQLGLPTTARVERGAHPQGQLTGLPGLPSFVGRVGRMADGFEL